jgi:short-subunit dehydrogenase
MSYNPFTLGGKTILITGASSGIGRETAVSCSKMGAKLIITARNQERLNQTFDMLGGDGHRQILADLTCPEDLESLVAETGKIDGLVLCAGKSISLPVLFSTREKFEDIFSVNFYSPVELLRLLVKKNASSVILRSYLSSR